ncbi:MAG: PLP-dependent lyase/thiolase [Candidatus Shapirobacteria bacterium]|jgi:threonine synthase|nr:PLP-dependent lyase/thiolase [Candidatus Shapirobacteria bacterium]
MANTPLIKLENVFFKREDLNITGSAKDRAIISQIDNLKKQNFSSAVISSTGNAAISAAYFCHLNQIKLTVFLSPKVNQNKLDLIKKNNCQIIISQKPISDSIKFAKKNNVYLLRQSTDPSALIGYQEIGKELTKELPKITSIFVPVGSGSTLLGISQTLNPSVKIFAVKPENTILTDALTVKYQPLKNKVISAVKNSKGSELIIQNKEILKTQKILESNNIKTSLEGAMAYAAYKKAIKNNFDVGDYPVIILTGCQR